MRHLSSGLLDLLWQDWDLREERLRHVVEDRLGQMSAPQMEDHIVATYFLALRTKRLREIGAEIAYHATSGTRNPQPGSLLAACTGKAIGIDPWDNSGRIGLLQMAFPLKMMLNVNGTVSSTDILHVAAGAILFDVYENLDSRLLSLSLPNKVVQGFPGPAHGPRALRESTGFVEEEPALGTILKPTAGITPEEVGALVEEIAKCPLLMFVKEDENLFPHVGYSPVVERTRRAIDAIHRVREERGDKGIVFAPHITGAPHEILETTLAVLGAGATAVMFSESFANGTVRLVREATKDFERPPAIYGHNAGIGVRTRGIWREVIDYLARLDGIDFRQTAPVNPGPPYIRPYRAEWEASEKVLTHSIPGIKPVMITRAGGLDQGNVAMNIEDAERRGLTDKILLLAGSAITSIKNSSGIADPLLGTEAMMQAIEIYQMGDLDGVPHSDHVSLLKSLASQRSLSALGAALEQRYPTTQAYSYAY